MKKIEIPHSLFYDLMSFKLKNTTSTADLSSWLASKTGGQFIVIEKTLLIEAIDSLEKSIVSVNQIREEFRQKWKSTLWFYSL